MKILDTDKLIPRADYVLKFVLLMGLSIIIFTRPLISGLVYAWSNTLFFVSALFLFFVWHVKSVIRGQIKFFRTRLDFLHLIYFSGFFLSWFFSINVHEGISFFLNLGTCVLVYFLMIQVLETETDIRLIIGIMLTAACLVCFFGIYQSVFGLEETREFVRQNFTPENLPESFRIRLASPRIFSTMIYPNTLAGYILLVLPLAFAGIGFCSRSFQTRVIFYSAVAGTILFAVFSKPEWTWAVILSAAVYPLMYLGVFFLTYSKGGLIAFFILRLFAYFVFSRIIPRRFRKIYYLGILLIEVSIAAGAFLLLNNFLHRAWLSLKVRLEYWQAAFGMIRDFTWLGTGPGTFGSIYSSYKLPAVEETRMAHNNFLQAASEFGIVTGFVFLMIWIIPVFSAFLYIKNNSESENTTKKWVIYGAFLSCVAFVSHGLIDFDLYEPAISLNAWVCLGLLMKYLDENKKPKIFLVQKNWAKALNIILGQILVMAVILILRGPYQAEILLNKGISAYGGKNLARASFYTDEALRLNPLNANAYYLQASICEAQNRPKAAIESYKNALKRDPFNSIYPYRMALIYEYLQKKENQDYSEEILRLLNQSILKYPVQTHYRLKKAKFLESVGRDKDALIEYEKALSLGADSTQLRETIQKLKGKV